MYISVFIGFKANRRWCYIFNSIYNTKNIDIVSFMSCAGPGPGPGRKLFCVFITTLIYSVRNHVMSDLMTILLSLVVIYFKELLYFVRKYCEWTLREDIRVCIMSLELCYPHHSTSSENF